MPEIGRGLYTEKQARELLSAIRTFDASPTTDQRAKLLWP